MFSPVPEPLTPETSDHSTDEYIGKPSTSPSPDFNTLVKDPLLTATELFNRTSSSSLEYTILSVFALQPRLESAWSSKFLVHLCLYHDSTTSEYTQLIKQDDLRVNECKLEILQLKARGWLPFDIEKLAVLVSHDLTQRAIREKLPTKSHSEVCDGAVVFSKPIPWTEPEIALLESYNHNIDHLKDELPCRSEFSITSMIRKLSYQVTPQATPTVDISTALIDRLIDADLTLDAITRTFPGVSVDRIVGIISTKDHSKFTAGEKRKIKEYIKEDVPLDRIYSEFPCRTPDYLKQKHNDIKFVSSRKTKFTSQNDRLCYEAQWLVLTNGESSSRRSRRRLPQIEIEKLQLEVLHRKKVKREELSPEEIEERKKRREALLLSKERKEEEKRQAQELKRKQREATVRTESKSAKKKGLLELRDLIAGSTHFQSVIGDKKSVEDGQKRKRIQAEYFHPESKPTTNLKTRPRQAEKNEIKRILKLEKITEADSVIDQIEALDIKVKLEIPKEKSKSKSVKKKQSKLGKSEITEVLDENYVSPFDPTDINADTFVPLNGRRFFTSQIYDATPLVPKLNFIELPLGKTSQEIMTNLDNQILFDDDLAVNIVKSHTKNYRSMPISFPLFLENGSFNPKSVVKVRFFMYPQHYELFVLAAPKSNELDPVYEIIKLFMIHYSLYFSYSPVIKEIITKEYCAKLESAVEENDFGEFMFVIEKWNLLMLELSPNQDDFSDLKSGDSLNKSTRVYLGEEEQRYPSYDDLKIETFYKEILLEDISPQYNLVMKELERFQNGSIPPEPSKIEVCEIPTSVTQELTPREPTEYVSTLFRRIREQSKISRFTMQQILLRIYSRVVSTDSRKLRSYKAFTAEVYGELLPSFTSEVLEKVNLLPSQKFYDLGSGVGNTTFQAALEFGACTSGGCELMEHASKLTVLQQGLMTKHLALLGLAELNLNFALLQSFVDNEPVRLAVLDCDVLIINNYLFDVNLNTEVGKLLYGLRPGTKIVSLRDFIRPRYRATGDSIFDKLKVEKHEMSDFLSVSWTANKVPYYISTVQEEILPEYLGAELEPL